MLVNGAWEQRPYDTDPETGEFIRQESQFRDWVTPSGSTGFVAEPERYRLYVSLACPWAHRTLIVRKLKGLESIVPVTVVEPVFENGDWAFGEGEGCTPDPDNDYRFMHELYQDADPRFSGLVTVPVLWDRKRRKIVNNESAEIIRMFNSAFDEWANREVDLYPSALRKDIDAINDFVYQRINNGVYRAGFAERQSAYESAVTELFEALDRIEARLAGQRYLVGERPTEADWRLFPTLARFDAVYVTHFKCNLRRLVDYPHLWPYTRDLYQHPGVAETVNLSHIKRHYFMSHRDLNPRGIVPLGPTLHFSEPHGRENL